MCHPMPSTCMPLERNTLKEAKLSKWAQCRPMNSALINSQTLRKRSSRNETEAGCLIRGSPDLE